MGQVIHPADLFGLRLEDPDELLADDFALTLRLGHAGELGEKTLLRVDPSAACPNVAIADEARGFYGVQFHPEVNHTEQAPR